MFEIPHTHPLSVLSLALVGAPSKRQAKNMYFDTLSSYDGGNRVAFFNLRHRDHRWLG